MKDCLRSFGLILLCVLADLAQAAGASQVGPGAHPGGNPEPPFLDD